MQGPLATSIGWKHEEAVKALEAKRKVKVRRGRPCAACSLKRCLPVPGCCLLPAALLLLLWRAGERCALDPSTGGRG